MGTIDAEQPPGPVPEANRPGHHPDVEQDKPRGLPGRPRGRHRFRFDPALRLPALLLGVTPDQASVEDIGKLAAIAAIRTGLNFFLAREIREERAELEERDEHLA